VEVGTRSRRTLRGAAWLEEVRAVSLNLDVVIMKMERGEQIENLRGINWDSAIEASE
jgi:hypothetical protein